LHYAPPEYRTWFAAVAVACAVAGHCWPLFAGFRGGMGLATAAGGALAASALAFLIAAASLIFLTLVMRHGARASIITCVAIPPVYWLVGLRGPEFWIALFAGAVLIIRFLSDWNRKYRELWQDREKS
jgi:glycerol-3-phosphate acyltransferase PlsY